MIDSGKVLKEKLDLGGPKQPTCVKEDGKLNNMAQERANDSVKPFSNPLKDLWNSVINAVSSNPGNTPASNQTSVPPTTASPSGSQTED